MKRYSKIAYISFIIVVIIMGFFIYKVLANNNSTENKDEKEKALSDIKYIENRLANLFNDMNNISFDNYKLLITEDNSETSSSEGESSQDSSSSGDSKSSKEEIGESKTSGKGESESSNKETSENNKLYSLEESGILVSSDQIDWKKVKSSVEIIYTTLYSMTLDLYQTNVNKDDIIEFNKRFDNLTIAVKNESKEDTLNELSILYNYLSKFIENCTEDQNLITSIKTKNNIFKAYSILDKEEWATISENINSASQEFTKLVTNVDSNKNGNQYNINKVYITINELQNSVLLKDKEIFLIKYKNVLEQLQNL